MISFYLEYEFIRILSLFFTIEEEIVIVEKLFGV